MKDSDEKAPAPQQKNILKEYTFQRNLNREKQTPEGPENNINKESKQENTINLNLTMTLFEEEIELNIKGFKEKFKVPFIQFDRIFTIEELKNFNKFLALLPLEKIFEVFQQSFEQKFDNISIEKEELKISLTINIMNVMTENILFIIPMIKMTNNDELESLKENIKFLDEERNYLKDQINNLNNNLSNILKKIEENGNIKTNEQKELLNIIEEKDKLHQEKEKELINNIEEKDKLHKSIEEELQKKFEEKEKNLQIQMEEKEKEIMKNIEINQKKVEEQLEKLSSQMKEVKEIENYVRDKIIIGEKKEKKEKKKYNCKREIKIIENTEKIFGLDISMYLIEEAIKFSIYVIQDNLKNNPVIYETSFKIDDFDKIKDYYKTQGGIEEIFNAFCEFLKNKKDSIKLEEKKINIKVKFPLGLKEEEISIDILLKNISLKLSLENIDKSLKELNIKNMNNKKQLNETKEEFSKNLLEKVYPIGSYYWSEKDINPGNIFGGIWNKIEGKFLFASDRNHSTGTSGGEERVTLSISEIPRHSHGYMKFKYDNTYNPRDCSTKRQEWQPYACKDHDFYTKDTTDSSGGNCSHNNMPPYIVANCWKRIK